MRPTPILCLFLTLLGSSVARARAVDHFDTLVLYDRAEVEASGEVEPDRYVRETAHGLRLLHAVAHLTRATRKSQWYGDTVVVRVTNAGVQTVSVDPSDFEALFSHGRAVTGRRFAGEDSVQLDPGETRRLRIVFTSTSGYPVEVYFR